MCNRNGSAAKRTVSIIMAIMVLFVVLFSAFFIANESGHDCDGDDCPICSCMQQCSENLQLSGIILSAQSAAGLPLVLLFLSLLCFLCSHTQETLVSRKVRLNN